MTFISAPAAQRDLGSLKDSQNSLVYASTTCHQCGGQLLVIAAKGDDGWGLKELRANCRHFEDYEA